MRYTGFLKTDHLYKWRLNHEVYWFLSISENWPFVLPTTESRGILVTWYFGKLTICTTSDLIMRYTGYLIFQKTDHLYNRRLNHEVYWFLDISENWPFVQPATESRGILVTWFFRKLTICTTRDWIMRYTGFLIFQKTYHLNHRRLNHEVYWFLDISENWPFVQPSTESRGILVPWYFRKLTICTTVDWIMRYTGFLIFQKTDHLYNRRLNHEVYWFLDISENWPFALPATESRGILVTWYFRKLTICTTSDWITTYTGFLIF